MHKVLKKLSCLAFLICISFFWLSSSNLRISVVGGTWDIVPEDLKRFSVANGAVLFESGWCNNFNYFGNLYPVQTKDHLGRTVIGYDPVKTDNVTKLVQTLFHRISPSFTDFSTTDLIKIQDPVTIAQLAALILVGLDTLVDGVGKIQTHYESLKLEIEKLKESPDAELKKDRKALKELDNLRKAVEKAESTGNFGAVIETGLKSLKHKKSRLSSYAAELNKTFDVYLKAQPNLQANQANLNVWLGPVTQLFKLPELKISPYKFACIVAGALQECQPYAAAPYPENLVYSIFLAFLWKTLEKVCKTDIEQNRFALQIYYRELSKLTGRNMELSDDTMLPEKINSSQAREKLIESLENTDEKPLALDSFLYYVLASRRYPPAESYALVHYKPFETDTRIVAFPDCMETSLANFFRRLSYDPLTATYSITTLETNLGITLTALARERLDLFFKNILDHTVWAALVSNIASVPYVHSTQQNQETPPCVRIDDMSLAQQYQAAGYSVIPPDQACYELFASMRTIILVLNHILDLNLFEGNAGQEALRADFVEHYFPLLCEKLHLQGQYALSPTQKEQVIDVDIIDKKRSAPLYSLFETNGTIHQFVTKSGHGEYKFEDTNKNSSDKSIESAVKDFLTKKAPSIFMVNLIINMYFEDNINFLYSLHPPTFTTIFSLLLSNADCAYKVVENEILRKINLDVKQQLLLFNLAQSQPDPMRKAGLFAMLVPVLTNADTTALIEKFAFDIGSNPSASLRRKAFSLLSRLVTKSKNREQKEQILFNISQSQLDPKSKAEAFIELAPLLVNVDTTTLMEKFALDIINDPSVHVRHQAATLLDKLIKNNKNIGYEHLERIFNKLTKNFSDLKYPGNFASILKILQEKEQNLYQEGLVEEIKFPQIIQSLIEQYLTDNAYQNTNEQSKVISLLRAFYGQKIIDKEKVIAYLSKAVAENRLALSFPTLSLLVDLQSSPLISPNQKKEINSIALNILNNFVTDFQLDPTTDVVALLDELFSLTSRVAQNLSDENIILILKKSLSYIRLYAPEKGSENFHALYNLLKSIAQKNLISDDLIKQLIETGEVFLAKEISAYSDHKLKFDFLNILVEEHPSFFLLTCLKELNNKIVDQRLKKELLEIIDNLDKKLIAQQENNLSTEQASVNSGTT